MSEDPVTFTVNEESRGNGTASIALTVTGMTGSSITPDDGPSLVEGQRNLIAGDDEFVWVVASATVPARNRSAVG